MDEKLYFGYPLGRAFIVYELDELETLKPTGKLFRMMEGSEIPWEKVHSEKAQTGKES